MCDKLFSTLDQKTTTHRIRQAEGWFTSANLAKEWYTYYTSKGKKLDEISLLRYEAPSIRN